MFCGCGGLSLGVWEAARQESRYLDIRLAVDWNKQSLAVYQANFRSAPERTRLEDVRKIFGGDLGSVMTTVESEHKDLIGSVDLIVAGPPCQGHSDLNNSTRRRDPRNGFYLSVVRASEVLRPKAVVIENVPTVLLDKKKVVDEAKLWFEKLDYRVSDRTINLGRFDVPQLRKRHILVAVSDGDFDLAELDDINHLPPAAGEYLAGLEEEPDKSSELFCRPSTINELNRQRVNHLFDNDLHNLPDAMRPACHREKQHQYLSMYGRMHWDKPAQTLTSGFGSMGQGRYVHAKKKRLLTPHEAARLQGFPDFFDFSSATLLSALREMIANAVPPQFTMTLIARLIAKRIL
jgi:DNA (cytosine-5)-methyltransferase 1